MLPTLTLFAPFALLTLLVLLPALPLLLRAFRVRLGVRVLLAPLITGRIAAALRCRHRGTGQVGTVTFGCLDFQLDNLIPLLVGTSTFRNRQEFLQAFSKLVMIHK